jgi:hypothetical protein
MTRLNAEITMDPAGEQMPHGDVLNRRLGELNRLSCVCLSDADGFHENAE